MNAVFYNQNIIAIKKALIMMYLPQNEQEKFCCDDFANQNVAFRVINYSLAC